MVGVTGFEPVATRSQAECSTKLSYTPVLNLAGVTGLEPVKSRDQNPVPYQLGYTPMFALFYWSANQYPIDINFVFLYK